MKKIKVNTKTSNYPVIIGNDTFKLLPELIKENNLPERVFVILDKKVEAYYNLIISKTLKPVTDKLSFISLSSSEKIKSFKTAQLLYSRLLENKFSRDTLIIAIGGGTIGDLAGFTASTFMRGLPLIHIPTTVLSCVDSSIGGKTAINYKEAKNLIGTFYQPSLVLIDTNFLQTLPKKEIISGLGEIIKYSYLTNGDLYEELLSRTGQILKKDLNYLNEVIFECVKIKAAIILKDEKEVSGVRKILNFGHTFAHAFESYYSYRLSHGKAVIAGIIGALFLSNQKNLITEKQLSQMLKLPLKFKSHLHLTKIDEKEILRLMSFDKKSKEEKTRFVLVKNFGEILIDMQANTKEINQALNKIRGLLV